MKNFDFSNFAYNPNKINSNPILSSKIKLDTKALNDSSEDEHSKDNIYKSRFGRKLKKINQKSSIKWDSSSSEDENLKDTNFYCKTELNLNLNKKNYKKNYKKNKFNFDISEDFKPLRKVNNILSHSILIDNKIDFSKPVPIKSFDNENSKNSIKKKVLDDIELLLNDQNDNVNFSVIAHNKKKSKRIRDFSSNEDEKSFTVKKLKKKNNAIIDSDEESLPLDEKYIDDIKIIFDEENDEDYESDVNVLNSDDEQIENTIKNSKEKINLETIKENILNLLNEGNKDELLTISLLTNKVLNEIISFRPYKNWQDVLQKIENSNFFSLEIIEKIQEHTKTKRVINYLMDECLKLSNKIKESVLDLKENKEPKCMNKNLKLKSYQLIGLNWLVMMHKQQINGILADEMGLGKTIQVISFFAYLREEKNINGPHLVVVPSSILNNWEREFNMWCPCIKILKYHGNSHERADIRKDILSRIINFEVLITTYNMLYSIDDRKFLTKFKFKYAIFDEAHMLKNMKSTRFRNLFSIKAKNRLMLTGTPIQNNLLELISLLTFTVPNLFYSKLNYMENFFKNKKLDKNESNFIQQKTDQAKEILKPFILRRIKDNVMKDLPNKKVTYINVKMTDRQTDLYNEVVNKYQNLIKLKKQKSEEKKKDKKENILIVENKSRKRSKVEYNIDKIFKLKDEDDEEKKIDEIVLNNEDSNDILFEDDLKLNLDKKNESITSILMELRKCANHPLLIRKIFTDELIVEIANVLKQKEPFYQKDGNLNYMIEDMQLLNDFDLHMLCKKFTSLKKYKLKDEHILGSGKFLELDKMLNKIIIENKEKLLIFSQFVMMLDIIQEYLNIKSIRYCRLDGSTKVNERMNIIDGFSDTDINVFLLTTKAGGVGINLIEANNVIIHDIDYNPFNDKQAEDRVHRLGQIKEVNVFKLISEATIEENMKSTCLEKLKIGSKITSDKIENNDKNEKSDVKYLLTQALKL